MSFWGGTLVADVRISCSQCLEALAESLAQFQAVEIATQGWTLLAMPWGVSRKLGAALLALNLFLKRQSISWDCHASLAMTYRNVILRKRQLTWESLACNAWESQRDCPLLKSKQKTQGLSLELFWTFIYYSLAFSIIKYLVSIHGNSVPWISILTTYFPAFVGASLVKVDEPTFL